jgi:uncharacterized protein (TIGR00290 family)
MKKNVLVSWSGGKDSCLALYEIQQAKQYEVVALLTTITRDYDRISMHGVRRELLEQQAAALGLPLHQVLIGKNASNEEYEVKLIEAISSYANERIDSVVFGDLFLEEIKLYRDRFLTQHNLRGLYPVWLRDTNQFIHEFIALGFKAIVTCIDGKKLEAGFAGRIIDESFLADLPTHVDPCGENGEFHTFVFAGPTFKNEVQFSRGEIVQREGFWFCDLVPQEGTRGKNGTNGTENLSRRCRSVGDRDGL